MRYTRLLLPTPNTFQLPCMMKTLDPEASFRSTERCVYTLVPLELFYFTLSLYVSCWRGTYVGEGILVFSCYLGLFSLLFIIRSIFAMRVVSMGVFLASYSLFYVLSPSRGTLFIEPTTKLLWYALIFEVLSSSSAPSSSLCSHNGDPKP